MKIAIEWDYVFYILASPPCFFWGPSEDIVLTDTPRLDSLLIVVDPVMYFMYHV